MQRARWLVPTVVAVLALATVAAVVTSWWLLERNRTQRLELVTGSIAEGVELELDRLTDLARAIAMSLPPREDLTNEVWQQIMNDLDVNRRHSAVFGTSFNERVERAHLDAWTAQRATEGDGFSLRIDAGGPQLRVIRYAYPLPANAPSVGLDVLTSPENQQVIDLANRTRSPSFAPAFQSSSIPEGEAATALYLPVEDGDAHVVVAVSGPQLLAALEPLPAEVTVALIEPTSDIFPVVATLPADGPSAAADAADHDDRRMRRVHVGPASPGWELAVAESAGFVPVVNLAAPWLALLIGSVITVLAGSTAHVLVTREQLAAARVEAATTQLATANAELVRADQHKDAFIASVSHELRTPLTAIAGFLETLRRIPPAQLPTDSLLAPMERNTARLRTLVDDLLLLASLDAGGMVTQPEPLVLARVVPDVLDDLGVDEADRRYTLPDELMVQVDAGHLERIVANLVTNALHHGAAPIHIRATAKGDMIALVVADTGEGIHPSETEQVFDRFARGRGAERSTGTGLGLAVVRELAVANGGAVDYRRCEEGPCFEVTLPRTGPPMA